MRIREFTPGIVAAFSAIYFIWGSTYLAIKLSIDTIPPFLMTGTRAVAAGSILYVWGRWRGGGAPTGGQWVSGGVVGAFLFLGGHGGLSWAEQRVPSGAASLFIATLPLWMTLVPLVTDREPALTESGWTVRTRGGAPTFRTACGILAGMAGIVLLLGPGSILGAEPVDLVGGSVLVLCALSWAWGSGLARRDGQPSSLTVAMGTYLLTGGFLLLLVGVAAGEVAGFRLGSVTSTSLVALGYLTIFGTVLAFSAYAWLLRQASMTAVSTYAFVNPIVAVFLGWSFGGERMSLRMLAAAALVAGAVALVLTGSGGESAAEPARPSFDVRAEKPRPTRVAMPVTRGRFYPLGAPHGGAPPTCPVTCTALTNRGEPA